jgi:hypothetical protein
MFSGAGTQQITVRGVTVDAARQAREGVWIGNGAGHITIQDTEVKHAGAHGVLIPASSSGHNVLRSLQVHHNGTRDHLDHGLYIAAAENVVADSRIYANKAYGVHIYASGAGTAGKNLVINNVIEDNATGSGTAYGLLLSDGASLALGNRLRNNGSGDILVTSSGSGSGLSGNTTSVPPVVRAPLATTTTAPVLPPVAPPVQQIPEVQRPPVVRPPPLPLAMLPPHPV